MYPHVYVDLSLTTPHLAHGAAGAIADALAMAPATKVLIATDASRIPELFWVAARHARRSLSAALDIMVAQDYLRSNSRDEIAHMILHDNARASIASLRRSCQRSATHGHCPGGITFWLSG